MDKNKAIPGSTAYKRLFDARTHWVRALDAYFSPDDFRIEINACIQALRNVTFVLQADKSEIPNFDVWYSGWQRKMRADEKMRWSVEARNTIVKAKDLELHSKLKAFLIGSYLENEIPNIQFDYSPQISTKQILDEIKKKGIREQNLKNSQLKIERRWVINEFPDSEFLSLLSHCWTFLSRVLSDLPNLESTSRAAGGWGLPPCMIDDGEYRSIWIKVATGEISNLDTNLSQSINKQDFDKELKKQVIEKYGLNSFSASKKSGDDFQDRANTYFEVAKNALRIDGYHMFIVMLFTKNNHAIFLDLRPEDQSDKYRMWRSIASEVKRIRASSMICISEVWTATLTSGDRFQHAAESPNRKEALNLISASEDGRGLVLSAPFERINGKIVIGQTNESDLAGVNAIAPILAAWEEMRSDRNIGE